MPSIAPTDVSCPYFVTLDVAGFWEINVIVYWAHEAVSEEEPPEPLGVPYVVSSVWLVLVGNPMVFVDGFESGNVAAWN